MASTTQPASTALAKSSMATQNTPARTKNTSTACSTTQCTPPPNPHPSFAGSHPANLDEKKLLSASKGFQISIGQHKRSLQHDRNG
jgi:hypothetical protein